MDLNLFVMIGMKRNENWGFNCHGNMVIMLFSLRSDLLMWGNF
jgi:hypothetical protein